MTARIAGRIVINRPVEEVFDVVADECNEPRYNPRMTRAERISTGPVGLGSRYHAETRSMGRTIEMDIQNTGYQRPSVLASSTHLSAMDIHGTVTFDSVAEGTLLTWAWDVQPKGAFKLLGPITARMGRSQEQAIWTGLKDFMEAQPAARSVDSGG